MGSMKRPSRRLRESVATILKNGRFLAPPRAKRITTIIFPKKLCWTEKADDYSAPRRASASVCLKTKITRRADRPNPALSPIFALDATSATAPPDWNHAEYHEKACFKQHFER